MSNIEEMIESRNQVVVKTGWISIGTNVVLAITKVVIGLLSNSISVVLDAVNNLTDAMSGAITILGIKLSNKLPDEKHPLGYGRMEFLSAMLVSGIVLYAGITSFVESVKKILHPTDMAYTTRAIAILIAFVFVKNILGDYVIKVGKKTQSKSLIASGRDAKFDGLLSFAVVSSAFLNMKTGISLEAYIGAILSVIIVKSGVEMMMETLDEILGQRVDSDLSKTIKQSIGKDEDVLGVYDLVLHSYGVNRQVGSVHVEVYDTLTAEEIDTMSRRISTRIYDEFNVLLTGIGIYSHNTSDDRVMQLRSEITKIVFEYDGILQMHGFYVDQKRMEIRFDIIIDFAIKDRKQLYQTIQKRLEEEYPSYRFVINMDLDI